MILYLNAQSVVGKLNELSCTLSEMEPDIVLITESWCNKEITDAHLGIPGYEMQTDLRRDRENTAGGRGGGVLVYTKTGLQILKLDNNVEFFQHCKFLVRDVTVYLLYRPPNGPAADLTKLANLISQSEKNCIIIGDFNLPNIDWEVGAARGGDKVVLEAVEEAMMTQMVDFSTQVRGNILDLVVTNMPERLTDVREEGRLGRSDHSMIVVEVSVGPTPEKNRPGLPDWRRADWDGMRRRLAERDWLDRVKAAPVEAAWKALNSMVEGLVKEFVPERRRRNQNRPPWLTRDILCAIRKKKRIWKRDKERYDKTEYKAQETLTRNLIRNAKRRYEKKLASGGDNHKRQFFAYVKQNKKSALNWPTKKRWAKNHRRLGDGGAPEQVFWGRLHKGDGGGRRGARRNGDGQPADRCKDHSERCEGENQETEETFSSRTRWHRTSTAAGATRWSSACAGRHFQKITGQRNSSRGLESGKCHPHLQKRFEK